MRGTPDLVDIFQRQERLREIPLGDEAMFERDVDPGTNATDVVGAVGVSNAIDGGDASPGVFYQAANNSGAIKKIISRLE